MPFNINNDNKEEYDFNIEKLTLFKTKIDNAFNKHYLQPTNESLQEMLRELRTANDIILQLIPSRILPVFARQLNTDNFNLDNLLSYSIILVNLLISSFVERNRIINSSVFSTISQQEEIFIIEYNDVANKLREVFTKLLEKLNKILSDASGKKRKKRKKTRRQRIQRRKRTKVNKKNKKTN
jgi:hypothetical protein